MWREKGGKMGKQRLKISDQKGIQKGGCVGTEKNCIWCGCGPRRYLSMNGYSFDRVIEVVGVCFVRELLFAATHRHCPQRFIKFGIRQMWDRKKL